MLRTARGKICSVVLEKGKHRGGVPDTPGATARLRAHMECAPTVWRATNVRPYMGLKMRFFDKLLPYYIYI